MLEKVQTLIATFTFIQTVNKNVNQQFYTKVRFWLRKPPFSVRTHTRKYTESKIPTHQAFVALSTLSRFTQSYWLKSIHILSVSLHNKERRSSYSCHYL